MRNFYIVLRANQKLYWYIIFILKNIEVFQISKIVFQVLFCFVLRFLSVILANHFTTKQSNKIKFFVEITFISNKYSNN